MPRRPDLPSRLSTQRSASGSAGGQSRVTSSRTRVDVRGWMGASRLSGFMVIMLCLVIMAVFVLVPSIGTYLEQRQRIASLQQSVAVTQQQVDALEAERDRWKDANFIATQARERLYYVKPGEVVYLVDNDLNKALLPQERPTVSADVTKTETAWMSTLVKSVTEAGLAQTVAPETEFTVGVPDVPSENQESPAP